MAEELIANKVYYKIFDRTFPDLTHRYNLKEGNELEIKNNIDIVCNYFDAKKLLLLNQVHGNGVICDEDFVHNFIPRGDASVTTKRNVVLGICTADCVPLLITTEDGSVIGAAHCGWRSAKANIIDKLANIMRQKGGDKLCAIIGPSIAQASYEVSNDFYQDFISQSESYKSLFIEGVKPNHYMFDLPSFVKFKLEEVNVEITKHITEDTYIMKDKYPSFRRCTHTHEVYDQSILSAIVIK